MPHRLKDALTGDGDFVVELELTSGRDSSFGQLERFLQAYKSAGWDNPDVIPKGFTFTGITCPQNPGGTANIETAAVLAHVRERDLLGPLDLTIHSSCKDQNVDAIISSLAGFRTVDVRTILAITGDIPRQGKKVYELDSIGLLELIKKLNAESISGSDSDSAKDVHQFFAGAVVSPFKYTEPSQMQQYYKMEKKIACGAQFLITQVGWDWKKSCELFWYLNENKIDVPVLGNVYLLTNTNGAARRMNAMDLPGCFLSDDLLEKITSETFDENIERAAQQIAMYRELGAAGIDLGGVPNFDVFKEILERAVQIGLDWQRHSDNLYWPAGQGGFYLYDENASRVKLSKRAKKFRQRLFNLTHRAILDPDHCGFAVFKKTMAFLGADEDKGFVYKAFNAFEKWFKYLLFDCRECGDCYLPEDFGYCTVGGCEKGMNNAPCGDATVDGHCGNNLERICIGEYIYNAAAVENAGIEKLRKTINAPRNPALQHSSSILNYLFARDHTGSNADSK